MGAHRVAGEGSPYSLTLPEVCDFVYVLWLDRLERLALAEQQMTVTFLAAGADPADVRCPSFEERVHDLDVWLASPLSAGPVADPEEVELMLALGLQP